MPTVTNCSELIDSLTLTLEFRNNQSPDPKL